MGSFYGGGAIMGGSIGGGGTTNYDSLQNTPIKNLTGTEVAPVVLSNLEPGLYKVKGDFKYDKNDTESDSFSTPTELLITTDAETGEKIAYFQYFENGELKARVVVFGESVEIKDSSVTGNPSCDCVWEQI